MNTYFGYALLSFMKALTLIRKSLISHEYRRIIQNDLHICIRHKIRIY